MKYENSVARGDLIAMLPLLGVTVFAKIGPPLLAARGIGVALLFLWMSAWMLSRRGEVQLDFRALAITGILFSAIASVHVVWSADYFSFSSLILFLTLVLPLCVRSGSGSELCDSIKWFGRLALFFVTCALYQFVAQKVLPLSFVKPIDFLIPESLLVQGYNAFALTAYGEETYRPNGIFFLEPSFYSQFIALAMLLELGQTRPRLSLLLYYGLGLLVSISGTGLVVLLIGIIPLLRRQAVGGAALLLAAAVAGMFLLPFDLGLEKIVDRALNFNDHNTSSYQRYLAGWDVLAEMLVTDPLRFMFGNGPGSFIRLLGREFNGAEMALYKLPIEYGVLGAVGILSLLWLLLFGRGALSASMTMGLLASYLQNGALSPFFFCCAIVLSCWRGAPTSIKECCKS